MNDTIEDVLADMKNSADIADSGTDDEISADTVREWVARIRAIGQRKQDDARGDALDRGE